jgi:hypothetical protein
MKSSIIYGRFFSTASSKASAAPAAKAVPPTTIRKKLRRSIACMDIPLAVAGLNVRQLTCRFILRIID